MTGKTHFVYLTRQAKPELMCIGYQHFQLGGTLPIIYLGLCYSSSNGNLISSLFGTLLLCVKRSSRPPSLDLMGSNLPIRGLILTM